MSAFKKILAVAVVAAAALFVGSVDSAKAGGIGYGLGSYGYGYAPTYGYSTYGYYAPTYNYGYLPAYTPTYNYGYNYGTYAPAFNYGFKTYGYRYGY